jgi:hypothetical protein
MANQIKKFELLLPLRTIDEETLKNLTKMLSKLTQLKYLKLKLSYSWLRAKDLFLLGNGFKYI